MIDFAEGASEAIRKIYYKSSGACFKTHFFRLCKFYGGFGKTMIKSNVPKIKSARFFLKDF